MLLSQESTPRRARGDEEQPRSPALARFAIFGALLFTACGGEEPFEPIPLMYNLCESDADCSETTPVCRALDPSGSGQPVSVCTARCERSCPHEISDYGHPVFACLGVDESGKLDASSDERFCISACEITGIAGDRCEVASGDDGRGERGQCVRLEYDEDGLRSVCLEPGTPTPPEYIPMFNPCMSSTDCTERTPDCRSLDYSGNGTYFKHCTRVCEEDADCPTQLTSRGEAPGRCLAVDAQGVFDPEGAEKLCFLGCLEGMEWCTFGIGTFNETFGACKHFSAGDEEMAYICS